MVENKSYNLKNEIMIYNDLALFVSVARHLSFSEAAESLGIPLSRVSRRIAGLETQLGVRLFERTTRQVRLTEEGRRLFDQSQGAVEALQNVAGILELPAQQTIRVTASPLAARVSIGPRLLAFAADNPTVRFDLIAANANLDFFRDNIDLAFRLGPLEDSNLIARRLWSVPYRFCAAAGFCEAHGVSGVVTREVLLGLPAVCTQQAWILSNGERLQPSNVTHVLDDLNLVADAARMDFGVALLPEDLVRDGLVPLEVSDVPPVSRDMYAVYPSRRLLPDRMRRLIDFMAA